MERWVLHADMDAFYASIEQRDQPELMGKPVIVGANGPRGVVSAASYEARRYGVRSAMPGFRARELCPNGVFIPGDMEKYVGVSRQVRQVFYEFTPFLEPLALDEAFLDISGSMRLFGSPLELGRRLKQRVREETQLAVSVGIAPNKLVAKLCCTLSKPDGLGQISQGEISGFMRPLPVRRLWGVGPVLEESLARLGIRTIAELQDYDPVWLERVLGHRAGELQALARGEDTRPVQDQRAPKSYGEENTFERDTLDRELISATLTAHAEAVAARLRYDRSLGRTITLRCKIAKAKGQKISRTEFIQEPIYPLITRSRTLSAGTDDGARIREVALGLWDELGLNEPVRLLGVSVSKLDVKQGEQLELFSPARLALDERSQVESSHSRRSRLGTALDAIRERYGSGAIQRAVGKPLKITGSSRVKAGESSYFYEKKPKK